jgi:2,3-dihydroxy-2,3-dihydro-p-cumate dehydrogenase
LNTNGTEVYKLKDKVAIVTGAAGGIGLAIANQLAKEGASVLIADILSEEAQAASNEIRAVHKSEAECFIGDISDESNAYRMIQQAIERWGKVDIMVNNAGGGVILPFLQQTSETLHQTINRNLWSTIWPCKAVLPHMIKQGRGRIINIGADSVRNGLLEHAAYNAAKGGVHGLTTGLAREFASYDITVNTVAPCAVATDRMKEKLKEPSARIKHFLSVIPKGRFAEMKEVAAAVSFLASDDAAFITGQVISVNGGSSML